MNGTGSWHDTVATAKAAPPELLEGVNTILDRAVSEGMTFTKFKAEVQALFNRLAIPMHSLGNGSATPVIATAGQ